MNACHFLTGQRFGRLTVTGYAHKARYGDRFSPRRHAWRCVCDCGLDRLALGVDLLAGRVKSCGCLAKDNCREVGKRNAGRERRNHAS
jgi:hypothetical protein